MENPHWVKYSHDELGNPTTEKIPATKVAFMTDTSYLLMLNYSLTRSLEVFKDKLNLSSGISR